MEVEREKERERDRETERQRHTHTDIESMKGIEGGEWHTSGDSPSRVSSR